MLAKVLVVRAHPEDPRGPLGASSSPFEAGAGENHQTFPTHSLVFLEPQRPDYDHVLQRSTRAAFAQCLPLQHLFYPVVLEVLRGQDVGPLGLQPSLQGPC